MFAAERSASTPDLLETGRILIIDTDDDSIDTLTQFLEKESYQFTVARTAREALSLYDSFKPELVLMDVIAGSIDGFKIAEKLTELSGRLFLPIIFITAFDSDEVVGNCLAHSAIDVFNKPYDENILKSRIKTYLRLARLEQENKAQKTEIESHNKQLKSSYDVAIDVFHKVIHSNVLDAPGIKYSISPISIFNGDLLLAAYRPSGELQIMLGDFTGHGLSAALGTIPVADIFYGMTAKGFGIAEIIVEINQKVMKVLPRGLFLAACLFEYDSDAKKISIWNAGLPDVLIYDVNEKEVKYQFRSRNYPLGVTEQISYTTTVENYFVKTSERLVLFTDGVIEARNNEGQMYGIDNVIRDIKSFDKKWVIEKIIENLVNFSEGKKQSDDTTVLEICFDCLVPPKNNEEKTKTCTPIYNSNWQLEYTFASRILKVCDPLPNIIQMIMDVQKLHCHKQDIFIILKELFVNALDHGLLDLDSEVKNGEDGFSKYVIERQKRLAKLSEGTISVTITHTGLEDGGILDVYMKDTGKGFDTDKLEHYMTNNSEYHSRGILMVNSICKSLKYNKNGNEVHAQYEWRTKLSH